MEYHSQRNEQSYQNLEAARKCAETMEKYVFESVREELTQWVEKKFKKTPHPWQLDVGESILLGLDTVVIAPTGAGKTLPFVIPLAKKPDKKIIIISPLIALQHDMVKRFKKMGLSAAAVNNETKSNKLLREIKQHKYNVILTSPEMCLLDTSFRPILTSDSFGATILAYVIDEAHCISQWSGDFRPSYGNLDQLRAFVPLGVPTLATSATLNRKALADVTLSLKINLTKAFYLNLGNDRPNITFSTQTIKSSSDIASLDPFFETDQNSVANTIPKTIIFTNSRQTTQEICRYIRTKLPEDLYFSVSYFHALRSKRAKKIALRKLRNGEIRVLVSTEAAGMGADIRNIKRVIQVGLPPSLTTWIQRAGRAGRDPTMQAEAIMLVEKSAFLMRRKKKTSTQKNGEAVNNGDIEQPSEIAEDVNGVEGAATIVADGNAAEEQTIADKDSEMSYVKKVEEPLRAYVEEEDCLRDEHDAHYDNPPELRKPPTGLCCDRKKHKVVDSRTSAPATLPLANEENHVVETRNRPSTPSNEQTEITIPSANSSPEKTQNSNGKRSMGPARLDPAPVKLPTQRRDERKKNAVRILTEWREKIYQESYADTNWLPEVILPDSTLAKIATNATLRTLADFEEYLKSGWPFAPDYAEEIGKLLRDADVQFTLSQQAKALENRNNKKQATQARKAQERVAASIQRQREQMRNVPVSPAAYMVPYPIPPTFTPQNVLYHAPMMPMQPAPFTPTSGVLMASRAYNTVTAQPGPGLFSSPYSMPYAIPYGTPSSTPAATLQFQTPSTPQTYPSTTAEQQGDLTESITPAMAIENSTAPISLNTSATSLKQTVKGYNPSTRKFNKISSPKKRTRSAGKPTNKRLPSKSTK